MLVLLLPCSETAMIHAAMCFTVPAYLLCCTAQGTAWAAPSPSWLPLT